MRLLLHVGTERSDQNAQVAVEGPVNQGRLAIKVSNLDRGVTLLKDLLGRVVQPWPDVEFPSAVGLGHAMNAGARAR